MKALTFVWGFIACSILGLDVFSQTETFDAHQDFESNFNIVSHPEEFLPNWSAGEVRGNSSRVFQEAGEGINGSKALGIQVIGNFNAQIYIKTSSKSLESSRISLKAKTRQNGSGNRPVYVFYSFSEDAGNNFYPRQQIGDTATFQNMDSQYQEYEFSIPDSLLGLEELLIKIEVNYGEGSGSAARLFIDDFRIHGRAGKGNSLEIVSVEVDKGNSLVVSFNQKIILDSGFTENSLSLNPAYGPPEKVRLDGQILVLEFSGYLYSNHYELAINHLSSGSGETWMEMVHAFTISTPTPKGAILINEIMADPNPKGLLPEDPVLPNETGHEYIELFNTADKAISLNGFSYNNEEIADYVLDSGAYVILTSSANTGFFTPFGNTVGVNPFGNLANNGGKISIADPFENVVDSLTYSKSWFTDTQKASGGWALERINPFLSCSDSSDWKASTSPQGGTPGTTNAVFDLSPDTRSFEIIKVHAYYGNGIRVHFSKTINEESLQDANFFLDGNPLLIKEFYSSGLLLNFPEDMVHGQTYRLQVHNLFDCSGMRINEAAFSFTFDNKPPGISRVGSLSPQELRIFFDETIIKPAAEIPGNYRVNQELELVAAATLMDSSSVLISLKMELPLEQYYSLSIINIEDMSGNVSGGETVDFLHDDQLDSVLYAGISLLDLYFSTDVDSITAGKVDNYTVDGEIGHPRSAFRNAENNKLVHLVFDLDLPQNRRTTVTVQNLKNLSGNYINTHKKTFFHDQRPISLSHMDIPSDSILLLHFNKPLLSEFAVIKTNYSVNGEIGHPETISQTDPQTISLGFGNKFVEGRTYELSIIGLRDVFGVEIERVLNADFAFDVSAPMIEEARLLNPYKVWLKTNEPVLFPQDSNILISHHGVQHAVSINEQEFTLSTEKAMTEPEIEVIFFGLTDLKGNRSDSVSIRIPNEKIYLGEARIVKADLLQIIFSATVDPLSAFHSENYRVNGQLPLAVNPGTVDFGILLTLEKELVLNDSVTLEIKSIKSSGGKENQGIVQKLFYDDGIQDLYFVNPRLIQVLHKSGLEKPHSVHTVFSLKDEDIKIQTLQHQTDPRLLQLVLDQAVDPDVFYALIVPPRSTLKQQLLPGSTRSVIWDQSPPKLIHIEPLNENELLVSFDEPLNPILSLVTSFYQLDNLEPKEVIPGDLTHQVILLFDEVLESQKAYELTVRQLEDLHRNAILEEKLVFVFDGPVSPAYKELIINELMAAPQAGNALPDTEYIELYNAGKKEVFLGGLSLSNSRNAVVLPREKLAPDSYLILTPSNQRKSMEAYGRTIGLNNWPALLNEGDALKILGRNGEVLDELSYTMANYGDADKAREGYSLELVNPFAACFEPDNLKPSESPERGTPGKINSLFDASPDIIPPVLLKAYSEGVRTIILEFSKRLGGNLEEMVIKSNPSLDILQWEIDEPQPFRMVVELNADLEENRLYKITVENMRDCSSNLIDPEGNQAELRIPVAAGPGDILLNEVLFNARIGGLKFVEIYNRSGKFISLKNWKLANASQEVIENRSLLSAGDLIIDPFSFLVFTNDVALLALEYPKGKSENFVQLSRLPGYPISGGTVILLSPEETLVERFDYDEKFHHALISDVKGVSLERFSLDHDVNDPSNWHSASATEGYATPGYKNSQTNTTGALERGITIAPEIFIPDAPGEQNFTTINYEMDSPGYMGSIRIYSINGRMIRELCQNDLWGSSGFYTWDGTEAAGNKVRPGYYIVWVQVLNLDGRVENIKKTVVVGSKF